MPREDYTEDERVVWQSYWTTPCIGVMKPRDTATIARLLKDAMYGDLNAAYALQQGIANGEL
jgi:hypothetical protein